MACRFCTDERLAELTAENERLRAERDRQEALMVVMDAAMDAMAKYPTWSEVRAALKPFATPHAAVFARYGVSDFRRAAALYARIPEGGK